MRRKDREVTDINEIMEILKQCKTANLAMVDGDMPYVIPLSYGFEYKENSLVLYFHCAKEGRKLELLKKNNQVCFSFFSEGEPLHAEIPCNSGYYYSSVVGTGIAEFVEETAEKCYALGRMFEHQTGRKVEFTKAQAETVCVFRVVSGEFTGKRKPKQ